MAHNIGFKTNRTKGPESKRSETNRHWRQRGFLDAFWVPFAPLFLSFGSLLAHFCFPLGSLLAPSGTTLLHFGFLSNPFHTFLLPFSVVLVPRLKQFLHVLNRGCVDRSTASLLAFLGFILMPFGLPFGSRKHP